MVRMQDGLHHDHGFEVELHYRLLTISKPLLHAHLLANLSSNRCHQKLLMLTKLLLGILSMLLSYRSSCYQILHHSALQNTINSWHIFILLEIDLSAPNSSSMSTDNEVSIPDLDSSRSCERARTISSKVDNGANGGSNFHRSLIAKGKQTC